MTESLDLTWEGSRPEVFAPRAFLLCPENVGELRAPLVPTHVPAPPDTVKKAVRDLLRFGGHKPSGRGRPASESLAKALVDSRWPTIHPLVDQANLLSLQSGLPISVLDADKLEGRSLVLRVGEPEESYPFNPSGQELSLKGLLLVADRAGPVGSPVKDSQRTKVEDGTERFLFLLWGTSELPGECEQVVQGLNDWCASQQVSSRELKPPG